MIKNVGMQIRGSQDFYSMTYFLNFDDPTINNDFFFALLYFKTQI